YLLRKGMVDIPLHEIEGNLNHASTFAALYNCWQTFWFIVGLFLRRNQGLLITELELVTFGFSIFTFATYVIWWDKP
ncbi:hypothetical protein L218DRAFT_838151, partial [Marasmius fiardii PR-910]